MRISPSADFITALTLDHSFSPPDIYPNRNLIAESTTLSITLFAIYWQMPPCSNYLPQQQISICSLYLHTPRTNQYLLFVLTYNKNKSVFTLCIWRHQQQISIYSFYLQTSTTSLTTSGASYLWSASQSSGLWSK